MIEDPWMILMVNRHRLGAPVYAVARGKRRDGSLRRTMRVRKALRFPTERRAANAARKLLRKYANETLFAVVKVAEGDFERPRREPLCHQTTAFPE